MEISQLNCTWWWVLVVIAGTSTLSADNLIQIGSVDSEIWQVKVKSARVRLFKQARLFGEIRYLSMSDQIRHIFRYDFQ